MSGWQPWIADCLALAGLAFGTLAVLGIWRLPDIYTKLHAAAKMASFGVAGFAAAAAVAAGTETAARTALVAVFVAITAAISSHAIARAAVDRGDRMRARGGFDESNRGLADESAEPVRRFGAPAGGDKQVDRQGSEREGNHHGR